jgi:hypothetical protein
MSELERQLTRLGRELDWPATPDFTHAVRERLAEPAPSRRRRPIVFRRSFAIALAALLVLAGGVFAAVPGVRDAVLEFLGLQGATVERVEQLPPAPELRPLGLGERTTLADARGSLEFDPLVPDAAGSPDGVFVKEGVPGGELSLTYRPRRGLPEASSTRLGLLVSEFRGDLLPEYAGKIAGQATRVERLRVAGKRAIWLEGAPHFFFYRPPGAEFREERLRIAQNVLLLERGKVLVRLEGAFGLERALVLARSLR